MDVQRSPKKAALYARVSTADQNSELQAEDRCDG